MGRKKASYLKELTTADLKQLLEARQRIDILEKEKARLSRELQAIEGELTRLVAGVENPASTSRAGGKKAAARKRPVKKAAKKVTKKLAKKVTKKTTKKAARKVPKKKAAKKVLTKRKPAAKKGLSKKTAPKKKGDGAVRLEDVIVGIIRRAGKPVPYREIMAAIIEGKLFTSKSANFDNVLRRTLSTSKKVQSAGRGIYDLT